MVTRRRVLGAALATTGASLFTAAALTPLLQARNAQAGTRAANAPHFAVPLPQPPVLAPVSTSGGKDTYALTLRRVRKEILPGVSTEVLTYNGHFPGPTIRARSGRPVVVRHRNALDTPASVHLHGASVPPGDDGAPMDTFAPGTTRTYTYPNQQPHAPLWYHDHAHHHESEHVYRGLSGSYLLTDDTERALPLPAGAYDIPIALRDARFDEAGRLIYEMDDALGRTTLLANGKPYPYLEVAARKYRFRLLNSSNLRFFRLRLADGSTFTQIGSDGGLLPAPATTDALWLSPAERADIVIDFSRYPVGTRLVLENTLGPGSPDQVGQVLRFDVVRTAADPSRVPSVLRTLPPLPAASVERSFELRMSDESGAPGAQGLINGKVFDHDRIDTRIRHGAGEIWTVTNPGTLVPHNFHLHLVQFRVLERNGKAPDASESGLKDTVRLLPGETVRLHATFDTYRGTYVYHCHLLDHSAMGMMAQMRIS
ncbi:multicopper oxidase domain-containing protein [Streptomyces sp. NPDC006283]|uniref:multicopper oxidase family protein n=1 Tax=Streptomyces sp. NPDC006283 TaxID=3156741 RepID=UPI0033B9EE5C